MTFEARCICDHKKLVLDIDCQGLTKANGLIQACGWKNDLTMDLVFTRAGTRTQALALRPGPRFKSVVNKVIARKNPGLWACGLHSKPDKAR